MSNKPDLITTLRIHKDGWPVGRTAFYLCRRSLARRLAADAKGSGDRVDDIGPAFLLCQAAQRRDTLRRGELILIGVADGDTWALWAAPAPREPVPGSPAATAAKN